MRLLMIHAECFAYEAMVKTPISIEVDEREKAREFDDEVFTLDYMSRVEELR